jgi:hypothetical protein
MKPITSMRTLLAFTVLLVAGSGNFRLLAQVSPPSSETIQPITEGAGSSLATPAAAEQPPSGEVQERGVPLRVVPLEQETAAKGSRRENAFLCP